MKRTRGKIIWMWISGILFLGLVPASTAGTYWVSPTGQASWAACQNATDPGSNYCSIFTANSNAAAGDIVYLKGGVPYALSSGAIDPAHSGTGINSMITFSAAPGETPVINQTAGAIVYGIRLGDYTTPNSYIKIAGITFSNLYTMALLTNSANHIEITNCTFQTDTGIENGGIGVSVSPLCPNGQWSCNPTNNWIHGNTFSKALREDACGTAGMDEGSNLFTICTNYGPGSLPGANGECNYNTIENNVFQYGGHSTFNNFGRFNVIKNNVIHNEPWINGVAIVQGYGSCTWPATGYLNSSYNGFYGHRNIELDDDFGRPALYNLIEGNRIGFSSVNPNNDGADNLAIAGPQQIIRYNFLYGAMGSGIYFKWGSGVPGQSGSPGAGGYGGVNNRVYNNTIYHNGYGYPYYETCTYSTCVEDLAGICAVSSSWGNVVKNNLLYQNRSFSLHGADIIIRGGGHPLPSSIAVVTNNWTTDAGDPKIGGDPKFVNADLTNPSSPVLPDLSLLAASPAIDGAASLTQTTNAGTNSTVITVVDALYFQDGSWGSDLVRQLGNFQADWIAVGTVNNTAQITSINYTNNTINLRSPLTWASNAPVWLFKDSGGHQVLYGNAPDLGAYEFVKGGPTPTPHPADIDGNFKITANEATTYGACWRSAPSVPANCPSGADIATMDFAVRAGTIWNSSVDGSYHYVGGSCQGALCWVP